MRLALRAGALLIAASAGAMLAAGPAAAVDPLNPSAPCSVFDAAPCTPSFCGVFGPWPCVPSLPSFGQGQQLTHSQPQRSIRLVRRKDRSIPCAISFGRCAHAGSRRLSMNRSAGWKCRCGSVSSEPAKLLGPPRVTYTSSEASSEVRDSYRRAVDAALERCTPMPFSKEMGGAVAGRPIAIRFVDDREER